MGQIENAVVKQVGRNYVEFRSNEELAEILGISFEQGYSTCTYPNANNPETGIVEFWK